VFVTAWGQPGTAPGQFNDPTGIAVHDGEVFVSDARNARIQVFDSNGRFRRQLGTQGDGPGQLGRPMNLTIVDGEFYVADYWNDRIQVFSLDGRPRRAIGRAGNAPGEFDSPGGVAVAPNGDLFVADFYGQRVQHLRADGRFIVQKFAPDGTFLTAFGGKGQGPGQFNKAIAVAAARDGTVFVVDYGNNRVQKWRPKTQ